MFLSRSFQTALAGLALAAALPGVASGQGLYATNGGEYAITGYVPGDQVRPRVSLNSNGGYLVWEDNITDGLGVGVSAMRLDSGGYGSFAPFRVNATPAGDQERADVAVLDDGAAVIVFQGGTRGTQHIYAQFLSAGGLKLDSEHDLLVNASTNSGQLNPSLSKLASGNVVVTYASVNQFAANSMQDVYGQILSPAGQKVGGEFLVNQFSSFNQRTPSVAGLSDGRFVVTWVSEFVNDKQGDARVDIYARLFGANGAPLGSEFLVNTSTNTCANPSVVAGAGGAFAVAWGERDVAVWTNGWNVLARKFSSDAKGGAIRRVNERIFGDQFAPRIQSLPTGYLVVWTSLGQDGSMEGIFGRFLAEDGTPLGSEFGVNSTTAGRQIEPALASDGVDGFLAVWSGFTGAEGMDLYAQRYKDVSKPLNPMPAPFVNAPFVLSGNGTYSPQLQVSWPPQGGIAVDHYEVFVDGSGPVASTSSNVWVMTAAQGLTANTTHSFQVAYVTTRGERSPLSPAANGTTWMGGISWGGVPWEWMSAYYGNDASAWPSAGAAVAPGGPTLLQLFLTGASPRDPSSWLRTEIERRPDGYYLNWNSQPGLVYQVQTSTDLNAWTSVGPARFAVGATDSVFIGGSNTVYYRILKVR